MAAQSNGYVKWIYFVPIILGVVGACMGASWKMSSAAAEKLPEDAVRVRELKPIHDELQALRSDIAQLRNLIISRTP